MPPPAMTRAVPGNNHVSCAWDAGDREVIRLLLCRKRHSELDRISPKLSRKWGKKCQEQVPGASNSRAVSLQQVSQVTWTQRHKQPHMFLPPRFAGCRLPPTLTVCVIQDNHLLLFIHRMHVGLGWFLFFFIQFTSFNTNQIFLHTSQKI